MIDDRNPYFGRGFRVSSAELGQLKRKWADVGRQVWDAGTRAGRAIKAETEQQLEALGRAHLQQKAAEAAQARVTTRAAAQPVRMVGDAAARVGAGVARQVRAVGRAQVNAAATQQRQAAAAADAAARGLVGMAKLPSQVLREGTPDDPGPWRLYEEYTSGNGPEHRVLGPESSFSREFVRAPTVQEYIRESIGNWQRQNGGVDMYANPRRRDFGVTEFFRDGGASNGAAHVIGTFGMAGERRGDRIDWWAENDMSRHSEAGGRLLDKVGIPTLESRARPGPRGTTHQIILFSTDLEGGPLIDQD